MARYIADLHCHSTASDGTDSPARVAERAHGAGLRAISLTDHDTVAGIVEAQESGARYGVTVIPGTELTCYVNGKEIHVLGYGIDIGEPELLEHCRRFQEARIERARSIGERLEEAGVPVDMDRVMATADGGVVGRPHVARALVEAGHVENMQEAFDLYLAEGQPANVPKMQITAEEVVSVIRKAGGIAVVAHPALGNVYDFIPNLIAAGCVGIEVWHSAHDAQDTQRLHTLALERGLLKTAGSDCHGALKDQGPVLGTVGLEEPLWKKFEAALADTAWGLARR